MSRSRPPDWDRSRLEDRAIAHAEELSWERGGYGWRGGDVDRIVVNMLRHEFTDYDETQSGQTPTAACRAIGARYPWLAGECECQLRRRRAADEDAAALAEMMNAEEGARRRWRRERAAESRQAIRQLALGMTVRARTRRHDRVARIIKLGRSRITVEFRIKSGQRRTAVLYARDVSPA